MELRSFVISALLIGFFIVAMVTGGSLLASQNNQPFALGNEEAVNDSYNSITEKLEDSQTSMENARAVFYEGDLITSGVLAVSTIFNTVKNIVTLPIDIYMLIFGLISATFGLGGTIIFTVLTAIVILTIITLIWQFIKTGS